MKKILLSTILLTTLSFSAKVNIPNYAIKFKDNTCNKVFVSLVEEAVNGYGSSISKNINFNKSSYAYSELDYILEKKFPTAELKIKKETVEKFNKFLFDKEFVNFCKKINKPLIGSVEKKSLSSGRKMLLAKIIEYTPIEDIFNGNILIKIDKPEKTSPYLKLLKDNYMVLLDDYLKDFKDEDLKKLISFFEKNKEQVDFYKK